MILNASHIPKFPKNWSRNILLAMMRPHHLQTTSNVFIFIFIFVDMDACILNEWKKFLWQSRGSRYILNCISAEIQTSKKQMKNAQSECETSNAVLIHWALSKGEKGSFMRTSTVNNVQYASDLAKCLTFMCNVFGVHSQKNEMHVE